jgi:hypothetical protein
LQVLPLPAPAAVPEPQPSLLTRMAAGTAWTWRRAVPFAKWGDRIAQRFAPGDQAPEGLVSRCARAWLEAAGPARQAELRLSERLGRARRDEDVAILLGRQQEDVEALERVLNSRRGTLPPDDPLPPYEPAAVDLVEMQRSQRETVRRFCGRAALHATMAATLSMWMQSHPRLAMDDLLLCLRSAIAGLPRWDGWHRSVEAGLVPVPEEGLQGRVESLFAQMLQEKGMSWIARMQARAMFRMLCPLMNHVLPRLGGRLIDGLHRAGSEEHLGEFLGTARQILEMVAHHLQQVVRIQHWANAHHPFLNEATGAEEDLLADRGALLQRELQKATYHNGIDWQEATTWLYRYVADRWCNDLFGFSESLSCWMRMPPELTVEAAPPRGAQQVWNLFRKVLFYLRLPLIAACIFVLRMIEAAILNPLARMAVHRLLRNGRAVERAMEGILSAIRPAPELQVEGGQATFRAYSYGFDSGLRELYRMVRQLLIAQRENPEPAPSSLQRLRDGRRLRPELDEELQRTSAAMVRNLLEFIRQMPKGVSRSKKWLLGRVKSLSSSPTIGIEAVGRLMSILMHDPLLRLKPAEVLVQRLEGVYSLDPEPSLAEKREMHNLQLLSRRWLIQEIKGYIRHEASRAVLGEDQHGLLSELSYLHATLLQQLPPLPEAQPERLQWHQEITRVVQSWEAQTRELSVVEQMEAQFGSGSSQTQVFTEIDRMVRRLQVVLRLMRIGEAGEAAEQPLLRRLTQDVVGLEGWRRGFSDRVTQTIVLLERLIRHTTVGEREPLISDRASLERMQQTLTSTGSRLSALGQQEGEARAAHREWNTWRRRWEGAAREIRSQQQRVLRSEEAERGSAQRELEGLWKHHHRLLSSHAPPLDPQGEWSMFSRQPWQQAWAGPRAEGILAWAREVEAQKADRLEELALQRRRESQIAQALELHLRSVIRSAALEGAEQPRPDVALPCRQLGELALALSEDLADQPPLSFPLLGERLRALGVPETQQMRQGLILEEQHLERIQRLERVQETVRSWVESAPDLPHYGPSWTAPESWRRVAQTLQGLAHPLFRGDLIGQGPLALASWRSLLSQRDALQQALERAHTAHTESLMRARLNARDQGFVVLAERLGGHAPDWSWQQQQQHVQRSIDYLIRRMRQLMPACAPPSEPGRIRRKVVSWGASLATYVAGVDGIGDALAEALTGPAHIQGLFRELVTRVGRAYASSYNVQLRGPSHRALRDGGAPIG